MFSTVQDTSAANRSPLSNYNKYVNYATPTLSWTRNPSWLTLPTVNPTDEKIVGLKAVYEDSNFLALSATTLAPTNIIAAGSSTDGTLFTTGGMTLFPGRLYLLSIENSHGTSADVVSSITDSDNNVLAFTSRATTQFNGTLNRVTLLSYIPTVEYAGALKINFANAQTGCIYNINEICGVRSTVNDGIVQTATATGNSTTPSVTLGAFSSSSYGTFGVVGSTTAGFTVGSGFTAQGINTSISTPTQYLSAEWRADNSTTVNATKTTGPWAIIGVELAASYTAQYTVDWGDGTVENVNSGTQANHQYDWSNSALDNTNAPVTFTASTSTVNRTSHGYLDGNQISFNSITTTTGISTYQKYFVVNATANTFQLSETLNGSPVTLTNDGSGIILPYKQAIVTVTGGSISNINLSLKNNQVTLTAGTDSGLLDIIIAGYGLSSLAVNSGTGATHTSLEQFSLISENSITNFNNTFNGCYSLSNVPKFMVRKTGANVSMTSTFAYCYNLRNFPLINMEAVTDATSMFSLCYSLQSVAALNTTAVTNMTAMFQYCDSLVNAPFMNTGAVTNMSQMFYGCTALKNVPLYNTSSVSILNNMFYGCQALRTVPAFNLSAATSMSSMFQNCYALEKVGAITTTTLLKNTSSMFQNCYALQSIPLFNTSAVTDTSNMFNACYNLQTIPVFNFSSSTAMNSMFSSCFSLEYIPSINISAATNTTQMFYSCRSLLYSPSLNTASATTMTNMFDTCNSLIKVPALNCAALTSTVSGIFFGCRSLTSAVLTGNRFSFTVASCKLSKTALENIFADLGKSSAATITITGNWGVDTAVTKSTLSTTAQSKTINVTNTTGLNVGMFVTGTGMGITSPYVTAASNVTSDILTLNNHGLANNTTVAFSALSTTTGVATYTVYYVINATTNTFQISTTNGGGAIDLTGSNANMTFLYPSYIESISTNTSITLSTPAASSQTGVTLTFRKLNAAQAMLKGWTVSY